MPTPAQAGSRQADKQRERDRDRESESESERARQSLRLRQNKCVSESQSLRYTPHETHPTRHPPPSDARRYAQVHSQQMFARTHAHSLARTR